MNYLHNLLTIFLMIYVVTQIGHYPQMVGFSYIWVTATASGVTEMVISCLVCGRLHERADKLYAVLDKIDSNCLSRIQYKDWIMFKTIDRKTRFGFTIGGFASLRKTTLITVCIEISLNSMIDWLFLDLLIHSQLHCYSSANIEIEIISNHFQFPQRRTGFDHQLKKRSVTRLTSLDNTYCVQR